jgi:hypothetical protein
LQRLGARVSPGFQQSWSSRPPRAAALRSSLLRPLRPPPPPPRIPALSPPTRARPVSSTRSSPRSHSRTSSGSSRCRRPRGCRQVQGGPRGISRRCAQGRWDPSSASGARIARTRCSASPSRNRRIASRSSSRSTSFTASAPSFPCRSRRARASIPRSHDRMRALRQRKWRRMASRGRSRRWWTSRATCAPFLVRPAGCSG